MTIFAPDTAVLVNVPSFIVKVPPATANIRVGVEVLFVCIVPPPVIVNEPESTRSGFVVFVIVFPFEHICGSLLFFL